MKRNEGWAIHMPPDMLWVWREDFEVWKAALKAYQEAGTAWQEANKAWIAFP